MLPKTTPNNENGNITNKKIIIIYNYLAQSVGIVFSLMRLSRIFTFIQL